MNVGGVGKSHGYDHVGDNEGAEPAQAAEAPALPRSGWGDKEALGKAVDRTLARVAAGASRPNHRTKWVDAKNTSKTRGPDVPTHVAISLGRNSKTSDSGSASRPDKPVIVAKYGVPINNGGTGGTTGPDTPVIAMKYGVAIKPGGTKPKPPDQPVIAMKYGVAINPGGTKPKPPDQPVIAMKYGGPVHGGGGTPDEPVIAMKYGVPISRR